MTTTAPFGFNTASTFGQPGFTGGPGLGSWPSPFHGNWGGNPWTGVTGGFHTPGFFPTPYLNTFNGSNTSPFFGFGNTTGGTNPFTGFNPFTNTGNFNGFTPFGPFTAPTGFNTGFNPFSTFNGFTFHGFNPAAAFAGFDTTANGFNTPTFYHPVTGLFTPSFNPFGNTYFSASLSGSPFFGWNTTPAFSNPFTNQVNGFTGGPASFGFNSGFGFNPAFNFNPAFSNPAFTNPAFYSPTNGRGFTTGTPGNGAFSNGAFTNGNSTGFYPTAGYTNSTYPNIQTGSWNSNPFTQTGGSTNATPSTPWNSPFTPWNNSPYGVVGMTASGVVATDKSIAGHCCREAA